MDSANYTASEINLSIVPRNYNQINEDTFIADSGATCHMKNTTKGMYYLKDYVSEIKVGNGGKMTSKKIGKYRGIIMHKDGTSSTIELKDVLYVPDLVTNLLSLTKAIENPNVNLYNKNGTLALTIGKSKIIFDKQIKNGSGRLLGVDILPTTTNVTHLTMDTPISYDKLHGMLGHANKEVVYATGKKYEFRIKG
jgi:hypothetical protein